MLALLAHDDVIVDHDASGLAAATICTLQ